MKQLAGYFRCDGRELPIYDGGNSIAPFAPYRAPGELRPLPADVLRMAQDDYLRAEQRARREHGSAYCTPSRYDSMMRHNMRGEEDYEELVYEPLAQPRRRVVPPPAVQTAAVYPAEFIPKVRTTPAWMDDRVTGRFAWIAPLQGKDATHGN